jgi:hypothetical protein
MLVLIDLAIYFRVVALTVEANSLDWFFTRRAMAENVTRRGAPKIIVKSKRDR